MKPTNTKLIIFDVDGTLADRETSTLLPGVFQWFEQFGNDYLVALATNQGGVGLRRWMEVAGFGEPEKFPTQEDVEDHIQKVIDQLPDRQQSIRQRVQMCFAYQSKKTGRWAPTPAGFEDDPRWNHNNRKPSGGMLIDAMRSANVNPLETLMIGDRDEDALASEDAGTEFQWADDFFGRRSNQ